jgi:hypothetical protein
MDERFLNNANDREYADRAQPATGSNPFSNLAYLPLRQVEQVLLSGFCADELAINLKPQYRGQISA